MKNSTFVSIILPITLAASAAAQSSRLSLDLQNLPASQTANVVIQYYTPPTAANIAAAQAAGASNGKALGLVKGNGYAMSRAQASNLLTLDPNVKYISVDRPLQMASDSVTVSTVGADLARNLGYDGTGVGVAVIDSGVNSTPDLAVPGLKSSRIVYSANYDPSTTTTSDLFGHGTHVASIIAGNGNSSTCGSCTTTYRGIAPKANIINLRPLDVNGQATDSMVNA